MSANASCASTSAVDVDHSHEVADTFDDLSNNTADASSNSPSSNTIHNSHHSQLSDTSAFGSQTHLRIRPAAAAAAAAATATSSTALSSTSPCSPTSSATTPTAAGATATSLQDKGVSTANRWHTSFGLEPVRGLSHDYYQEPSSSQIQLDGDNNSDAQSRAHTQATPSSWLPMTLPPSSETWLAPRTTTPSESSTVSSVSSGDADESSRIAAPGQPKAATGTDTATAAVAQDSSAEFSCNICFDTAISPVLTLCGHLFCWSCLHQWLVAQRQNPLCPVCKAGCGQDKVIPIYGRGREQVDPRTTVPKRPAGQRPEPVRQGNGGGFPFGGGQVTFSGTMIPPFMFSPLGIQFGGSHATTIHINTGAQTPGSAFVSRIFLMLGVMMLVAILLY